MNLTTVAPGFLDGLFSSDGLMPHGHCYLWNPALVALHVGSDALTALAYATIPFTLVYLARKRKDVPFNWMLLCFGLFIVACGATHAMEIWTLWTPTYWLAGGIKAVTAGASVATAVVFARLVPQILALPTGAQLVAAHEALREAHDALERRVEERTAEIAHKNAQLLEEIAERRRAEDIVAELREKRATEARFKALADNFPGGVIMFDHDLRYTLVRGNSFMEIGLGGSEGKTIYELFPPDLVADTVPHYRDVLRGISSEAERQFDGRTYLVQRAPVKGEEGEIIAGMVLAQDITARIAAEAALRESEERYRLLFEKAGKAIYIVEAEGPRAGAFVDANQAAASMHGYALDELLAADVRLIRPPEVPELTEQRLARILAAGWSAGESVHVRKDGTSFPVAYTAGPLDVRGQRCLLAFVRDVTEEKRAVEALRAAKESAELANRELESFSYSVAHDLRAPLRGMSGFAQILLHDYGDTLDAEGVDHLGEILVGVQRMGALIDALLSLSRVTRSALRRELVDLTVLARAAATSLAAAEPGRRVEVVVEDGLRADVDLPLVRTLLENLLGNAWKFTRDVVAARIEVGVARGDGAPAFFVRDNGAGFDMTYAGKLFGAFQRLHTVSEFPGTGIGLATVQRIVHRHGGRIWAEGVVGEGATFYFTFPARPEATS